MKKILEEVELEVERANGMYPAFHSPHEGYAVIKEEIDELWEEIRANKTCSGNRPMRNEAVQVAAMAIKFIENLCHD